MIKTTAKAKTPLGLDKDGPGEIPVILPEDWVGSLKDRNFEEPVLGMDGVPNFWREQLVWENPRIKASHTFFKSLAKDKDLNQVVPLALHLGPQFVVCYRRAGQPRSSVGRAGVGQPRSAVGRGRVEDKDRKQVVPFALHLGPQKCFSVTEGLDSPEDKDRKQVVPFALHLGLPESFFAIQKGWTAQIFGWKRNSESFCVFRHGDAAPHTETDSLLTVSMRSMTSKLPVNQSQLVPWMFNLQEIVEIFVSRFLHIK